jgi:hypothetical protein
MNKREATNLGKTLLGLFPSASAEQADLFSDQIGPYAVADVEAAMKTHAVTHNYLDLPNLMTGIRALSDQRSRRQEKRESQRIIDWLRETLPVSYPAAMSDQEAILTHFSTCWQGVAEDQRSSNYGKQFTRRYVWSCCVMGLAEIGIDRPSAETLARACVGMAEGEAFVLPTDARAFIGAEATHA